MEKKQVKNLGIVITIVVVIIFILSYLFRDFLQEFIKSEAGAYGLIFVFFISAFLEVLPQYISPHLLILNFAFLNSLNFETIAIVTTGSTFGAIIGFDIGRRYGISIAENWFGQKKVSHIEKIINNYGKWIVALAAVSPIPYVPLIFGSLGMKRNKFYLFGLLPRAIGLFLLWLFFA